MKRGGFTFIELAVVLIVIAILASILFPVFVRAREKARTVVCMNNLSQLGMALHLYAQDYGGSFPPSEKGWADAMREYVRNFAVFRCPSAETAKARSSYWYEPGHTTDERGTERLLFDTPLISPHLWRDTFFLHAGSVNVLFLNGKVENVRRDEWLKRGWPIPEMPSSSLEESSMVPRREGWKKAHEE